MEPLSLLQYLKPSHRQRYDYAILATFNADLRFFEQHVLANLRAQRVLCLIDASHYQQLTHAEAAQPARYAGVRYQAAPVFVPGGVFHPKFILCLSEKRFRLFLGSHNLTQAGYLSNAEIFTRIEGENDLTDETTALASELCDFLEVLTQGPYLTATAQKFIHDALKLRPVAPQPAERRIRLVHSMGRPILDSIETHLAGQPVTEVHVLSPFFGHDASLFEELAQRFNNQPSFKIYIQPGQAQFDPTAMQQWHTRYRRAQVHEVEFVADKQGNKVKSGERYLHAKLLGLVTPKATLILTGSPNFTRTALALSAARQGNIETALLECLPAPTYIKQLLGKSFLQIHPVRSWLDLQPGSQPVWPKTGMRPALQIAEAHYALPRLTLELKYAQGKVEQLTDYKVAWCTPGGQPNAAAAVERLATGRLSVACDLPTTATLVWVEATDRALNKRLTSDRQWITFPQFSTSSDGIFGADEFDQCVNIGGMAGVREALKLASANVDDQPNWLIAFLQNWDLGVILAPHTELGNATHPPHLSGHVPRAPLMPNLDILQRSLTMLTQPSIESIRQDLVQQYRDRTVKWLEQGEEASDVQVGLEYATVFNLLCLLLILGFKESIRLERNRKEAGKRYPEMQYGHVRDETKHFIEYYQLDWEKDLQLGRKALAYLPERKAGNLAHLSLFHWAQMVAAYDLAYRIVPQLDLEAPVVFKPLEKACVSALSDATRTDIRHWLSLPDAEETLNTVVSAYDLVSQLSLASLSVSQIRANLEKLLKTPGPLK